MTDSTTSTYTDTAQRSQDANIADESAGYVLAANRDTGKNEPSDDDQGIPQTGEEDPLAEVSTTGDDAGAVADLSKTDAAAAPAKQSADDSIEPSRIPGTAEDIVVAGVTGSGPSG